MVSLNLSCLLAPAQTVNTSTSNAVLGVGNPLKAPSLSAPAVTESLTSAPPLPSVTAQLKPEPPKSSLLQILTKPLENDSQSGFKPIFPTSVTAAPVSVPSTGPPTTSNSVSSENTFKPIFGDQNSQPAKTSSTFKPIFGDSAVQPPASSSFTFQTNSTSSAASSLFSGFGAKSTNTTVSTESATKPSVAAPTSSSNTNTFTSSLFSAVAPSASGSNPASVNSFPASNAPSDTQAKQFVFGQMPTSQANSGLNMFSSTQPVSTAPQPQQPPLFGSNTSAFTTTIGSNPPPPYPTNPGTSAFNSTSGSGNPAEKPAQNSVGFGSSGTQPAFGAGSQPAFGGTSQPTFGANSQPAFGGSTFTFGNSTSAASKVTFGNMNSTQTNSTPATNMFASKPFNFGESANSAPAFGTPNAAPAQSLGFGNSVAQNNNAIANPSTPLNFGTPAPAENKLAFGE